LNLSWELDLWGRVRRQVGEAAAVERAAEYDLEGALLSLRGELTRAYLSLRFADADIALLERTARLRAEARRLMKLRFEKGGSSRLDYERAVTEHEAVRAELAEARADRSRYENAVAALVGRSPSGFAIAPNEARPAVPRVPAGVPSDLLRRRPDIAAAERRLAAASERIGLVVASYLPRISIGAAGGVRSLDSSALFNSNSQLWSLGPELQLPTFQGGALGANRWKAEAAYREALARYRDTLLQAVRETEDALSDGRRLGEAAAARSRGAASARNASALTHKRYEGGATDYFEVVDADRTSLLQERAALATERARVLATTRLIQALGGGWSQ
jgi:multidrug efflux system outer membrane protein